jgi:hypothetical protein
MPPAGFEPPFPASGRLQTHALDRAPTGISIYTLPLSWRRNLESKGSSTFSLQTDQKMTPQINACTDTLSAAYQVRHRPSLRVLLTERLNANAASHTLMAEFITN